MAEVGAGDVEHTIEMLRKQRVRYEPVRAPRRRAIAPSSTSPGRIDGVEFPGGQAKDFAIVLGEGRMLPEFEAALPA